MSREFLIQTERQRTYQKAAPRDDRRSMLSFQDRRQGPNDDIRAYGH